MKRLGCAVIAATIFMLCLMLFSCNDADHTYAVDETGDKYNVKCIVRNYSGINVYTLKIDTAEYIIVSGGFKGGVTIIKK